MPKIYTVRVMGYITKITQDDDGKFVIPNNMRGLGSSLKPAYEPIILCRKPLSEKTVAANVLKWGTGAINIDACRVPTTAEEHKKLDDGRKSNRTIRAGEVAKGYGMKPEGLRLTSQSTLGRFPANLLHDGRDRKSVV